MPSLDAHLNSLNFSNQLVVVKNLLDAAQVKTTFWGSRVVKVNGFSGSVYLDVVATKVISAGHQRSQADDLLPPERIAGAEIVRRLGEFYRISDAQIRNSNFLTKFLNWIREFSFTPHTNRFHIEETARQKFLAYSKDNFLQQFGGRWNPMFPHPASEGSFSPPFRIVAKEERIRELLI